MAFANYPIGVSYLGGPLIGSDLPVTTGTYFFVDSATGTTGNDGTSPAKPKATIDQAHNLCTADNGDVIIVMPGHAETISSATALVFDTGAVSVVGLGHGRNRPVISFDNTASRIPISANDISIDNLVFLGAVADIVSGVTVTGDDVTITRCDWEVGSATLEFLEMLDIDAATRPNIVGCRFIMNATAGGVTGIRVDACVDGWIRYCEFRGDFTTSAISGTAGSSAASTNFGIGYNLIENLDTTAGTLLDHHDDTTGITVDNRGFSGFTTNITASFDTGATRCVENLINNLIDETGGISPTPASA